MDLHTNLSWGRWDHSSPWLKQRHALNFQVVLAQKPLLSTLLAGSIAQSLMAILKSLEFVPVAHINLPLPLGLYIFPS